MSFFVDPLPQVYRTLCQRSGNGEGSSSFRDFTFTPGRRVYHRSRDSRLQISELLVGSYISYQMATARMVSDPIGCSSFYNFVRVYKFYLQCTASNLRNPFCAFLNGSKPWFTKIVPRRLALLDFRWTPTGGGKQQEWYSCVKLTKGRPARAGYLGGGDMRSWIHVSRFSTQVLGLSIRYQYLFSF